jgi:hypothetical protein
VYVREREKDRERELVFEIYCIKRDPFFFCVSYLLTYFSSF